MRPQEIIATKRDNKPLSDEQITAFVDGVCDGSWADYQITALVMAIFIRGLNRREQYSITGAMLHSGTIMDFSDIDAPKADKHSTGGVGDKTSLVIAPLAAACGIAVPMISGRGLGHTGGTLDKLESIPGFDVNIPFAKFKTILKIQQYYILDALIQPSILHPYFAKIILNQECLNLPGFSKPCARFARGTAPC